jgi:predicted metal-dependent hydrolase
MTQLTIRSPNIALEALDFPLNWCGGSAFRSQFFNTFSQMFPVGEGFFVETVREALPLLTGPALAREARAFMAQESIHSAVHRRYNARLETLGLRGFVEHLQRWQVQRTARYDIRNKLALVMAFEHFTAMMGDLLTASPEWLEGAPEPLRELWLWHAAEECEHRALAGDVYRALGGGERRRIAWFVYVNMVFLFDVTAQMLHNLLRAGALWRPGTWAEGAALVFGRHGIFWRGAGPWARYFRPGFSPRDAGENAVAAAWLAGHEALFGRSP